MDIITIKNPDYHKPLMQGCQGNPLIEALDPIPLTDEDIVERLIRKPQFDKAELNLPARIRKLYPLKLRKYMYPTSSQVEIFSGILMQVFDGYLHRNPLSSEGQAQLYQDRKKQKSIHTKQHKPGTISFLTGLSGMGKSITIETVLNALGATVILHNTYKGRPFTESQIVALKSDVQTKMSPKMFARRYGETADAILDTDIYKESFKDQSLTAHDYMFKLHRIINNHFVGILSIDEFQNIQPEQHGEDKEIIDLILDMRQKLGVPIILSGTYKAANHFIQNASNARRFIEGGYWEIKPPTSADDPEFCDFIEAMWQYQWLKDKRELSEEIRYTLYDCSMGITAIFLNLFIFAQHYALDSKKEYIDAEMIKEVYRNRFKPLHNIINCLRSDNPDFMVKFDDLYLTALSKMDFGAPSNVSAIDQIVTCIDEDTASDINRLHGAVMK